MSRPSQSPRPGRYRRWSNRAAKARGYPRGVTLFAMRQLVWRPTITETSIQKWLCGDSPAATGAISWMVGQRRGPGPETLRETARAMEAVMSNDQNKAVVRRFIEAIVNTGDVSQLAEVIAPDCRESNDPTGKSVGLESMRAHVLGVRQTYPDLHVTIERQIAEGEWVASQITARGTHLGAWAGIAPTGKPVTITGVNLDRVVDGRIVEHGGAANMLEALLEIGAFQIVTDPSKGGSK